jgi:long-chain acyl-CoA synthetase
VIAIMPPGLLQRLREHARKGGDRPAYLEVRSQGRELSYAQLLNAAERFSTSLGARMSKGGVIILSLPNCIEYPVAFLGILAAGHSVFPVSPEIAQRELQILAREARAVAIVGTERTRAALESESVVSIDATEVLNPLAEREADRSDPRCGDLLLCSSGTTDRPKIVVRDAASLDAVCANMVKGVSFTAADRVLAIVPLCHSYGLEHGLLAPLWAGSTVHLCAGLDMQVVQSQLSDSGVTIFPSVPSVFDMMCQLGSPHALPTLRKAYAAGAPLPLSVFDAFEKKFGVRIGQLYGATEIGSVTFSDPVGAHFDAASVGLPFDDVEIRIVEGEVLVRAPSMFRGYLNEPASGYFHTGDLGHLDEYGNLTITGRLKLLIEVGGLKVNVLEVEDLLAQHPSVAEAAVVAVRVSDTVSRLKAVVTPRCSDNPPVPEDIRRFLRERLTAYKVPRLVEVRDSLPRSPAGKILRRQLEGP